MSTSKHRILILDGESRASLAVVRSLGQLNVEIGVASHSHWAISAFSNACDIYFPCPSPQTSREEYQHWLLDLVSQWKPSCLLPITDLSLSIVCDRYNEFANLCHLPFPPIETLQLVQDKVTLLKLAAELGIQVPSTIDAKSLGTEEIRSLKDSKSGFVAKPRRADADPPPTLHGNPVQYFSSGEDLLRQLGTDADLDNIVIQERISGYGLAVSALFENGECRATFCHRRLLEKPPTGGVSVLSESISPVEAPVADALKLLTRLKWHGIAMVEFKRTNSGRFVLMEINPRFWGTTQLAVDSGVDLPLLLLQQELVEPGKQAAPVISEYKVGQRLRWWCGTLDHLLLRLRERPSPWQKLLTGNGLFIFSAFGRTRSEVLRFSDPTPGLVEIRNYISDLL